MIFSLLGVVIVVTIREFLDYTVKTIEEIDRKGLTILCFNSSLSNKKNRKKKTRKYQNLVGDIEKNTEENDY